jgi:DNA-binding beta-propeller fold protein YncE/predicted Ser/Thr protein kinase
MQLGTDMTPLVSELTPGDVIAGYRIEGVAGAGGMGVVYRASDLGLGRAVALKVIAPGLAGEARFRERFELEARAASAIDHPNVIPVYDAGESEGRLFIAMRYVDGTDLGALIERRGALDPARAARIVGDVAAALDAAHRRGLVHRDVKPANVLVSEHDREHVYLTDFGVTKSMAGAGGPTITGELIGTVDYLAPEQIRGDQPDARADVYALGCVLYHALTGRPPFREQSDYAKMMAHLEHAPPSVTAAAPGVPAALDAVVRRAMAKSPGDRYASAGDLARAAHAALDEPSAINTKRGQTPVGAPAGQRRRTGALAVGGAVVGAAVVAAALVVAGGGDGDGGARKPAAKDAGGARAVASIRTGRGPEGVAVDGDRVFVANAQDNTLARISAGSNRLAGRPVPVGDDADNVAAGKGIVWVTATGAAAVQRLRAQPAPVAEGTIPVGGRPEGISLGPQLVWVANSADGTVTRIDRASATKVGGPIGVGAKPSGLFVGKDSVWVTNNGDGTVTRIDIASTEIVGAPIRVGRKPRGVVEGLGSVWVANSGSNTVTRIDPRSGRVVGKPIRVGRNPREIAVGEGSVWVANNADNTVTRVDPRSGRVVGQPIPVGRRPLGVAVGAGAVWVANHGDGTVTRIRP